MLLIPSIPRSLLSLLGILLLAQDVHGIGYHGQQCVLKKHNAPPRFKSSTPTTPQQTQTPIVSMSSTPSPSPSPSIAPVGLSRNDLDNVRARLLERVFDEPVSWEWGTTTQALIEMELPLLSVFSAGAFPPPLYLDENQRNHVVFNMTRDIVANKPPDTLWRDGSSGDPASLGVAVVVTNWTRQDKGDMRYAQAATDELFFVLRNVSRTSLGAISHRTEGPELWADFMYMVPPFLAYYGSLAVDPGWAIFLLREAYTQCRLYRQTLQDEDTKLWRHTLSERDTNGFTDPALWATGNAWAAAGLLRVREAIRHSRHAGEFVPETGNLTSWIEEILDAAMRFQRPNGAIGNYIVVPDSFDDMAATALLGAVAYRLVQINGTAQYLPFAERALNATRANINADGWLENTVDPYVFNERSKDGRWSPEAQAFVLLLHSAWRDYYQAEGRL